MSVAKR